MNINDVLNYTTGLYNWTVQLNRNTVLTEHLNLSNLTKMYRAYEDSVLWHSPVQNCQVSNSWTVWSDRSRNQGWRVRVTEKTRGEHDVTVDTPRVIVDTSTMIGCLMWWKWCNRRPRMMTDASRVMCWCPGWLQCVVSMHVTTCMCNDMYNE